MPLEWDALEGEPSFMRWHIRIYEHRSIESMEARLKEGKVGEAGELDLYEPCQISALRNKTGCDTRYGSLLS